jgi:uncharacterized protein
MNPFFFGDSGQQLFGVYHPAHSRSTRGVVICHPWAREYLLAYPTLKLLAHRLAEKGWHVLRFDYLGTGDSAGDSRAGNVEQWVRDVHTAIEELEAVANVHEIALVGMRLGAVVAGRAAAERDGVRRLVLWEPVTDGRAYLTELGVAAETRDQGDLDVSGSVLTDQLRSDVESITHASFGKPSSTTLVVATDAPAAIQPLTTHLRTSGVDVVESVIPDVPVWRQEWELGGTGLAVNTANYITQWLS